MDIAVTVILIFVRLAGVVFVAPILGHRAVGLAPRLVITVCLTLLAFPLVESAASNGQGGGLESAVVGELMIGLSLGLGVTILFATASMVGNVIGQMAGIQFATELLVDGANASTSVGSFFTIVSLAVFALINGPEMVLTGVLDTYTAVPVGSSVAPVSLLPLLIELLQQSFVLLLRAVAPAVAALLIATIVVGMISRSYPQLNMFQFGIGSNLVIMLLAIFLTLGGSMWLFMDDLQMAVQVVQDSLARLVEP